jgi:hypothetical protein
MSTITTKFIQVIDGVKIQSVGEIITTFTVVQPGGTTDYNVLNNKPQINSVELSGNKTSSDLGLQPAGNYATATELDTKVDKVIGKGLSSNDYTTDEKTKLAAITGTNTGDQDLSGLQPKKDASLETDSKTIVGAINEVNSVAKGANKALSFTDYQDVISKMSVTGLNVGQNLYIEKLNIPDLWIKSVENTNVLYTYVSDAQFVNDILAGVQIGYYKLSVLETQKVDLTNYYTKNEINTNFRNETQSTIGALIETTELTEVSDTTKIAASDNSFLKWFSGLRIYTYLKSKFDSIYQAVGNYVSINQNTSDSYLAQWDGNNSKNLKNGLPVNTFLQTAGVSGGQKAIGGTGANDALYLQGTSGNGNLTGIAIKAVVGNNGADNALTILNNGNIGVGTSTPGSRLSILGSGGSGSAGPAVIDVAAMDNGSYVWGSRFTAPNLTSGNHINTLIGVSSSTNNMGYMSFKYNSSGSSSNALTLGFLGANDLVNILANGNIGLGTTNPVAPLHVIGTVNANVGMILQSGAGLGGFKLGADVNSNTLTAGLRKLARIVMPAFDAGSTNVMLFSGDITGTDFNDVYFGGTPGGSQYAATGLHFITAINGTTPGGTERFTVLNNGNIGIGTTTPTDKLQVNGSSSATTAKGGTDTDYVQNDANGIHLFGAATQFDDLSAGAMTLQQNGSGVSLNIPECSVDFTSDSDLSDYVVQSIQLSHAWKLNSVIFPHIHFVQTTNAVPNFLLQYRWQIDGGAATTDWTNLICNTAVFAYSSGSLNQIAHTVAGITPPSGANFSDGLEFRVIRDNSNTSGLFSGTDPVSSTVSIKYFDIHIEKDSIGSNSEYSKN